MEDRKTTEELLAVAKRTKKLAVDAVSQSTQLIERLEKKLAEDEPVLKHGDYGYGPAGPWVRVHGSTWWDTKDCSGPSSQDANVFLPYRLGNIFTDLAAMAEPLEEFEMAETDGANPFTGTLTASTVSLDDKKDKHRINVDLKHIPAFILNLQRLWATHLRKQA